MDGKTPREIVLPSAAFDEKSEDGSQISFNARTLHPGLVYEKPSRLST